MQHDLMANARLAPSIQIFLAEDLAEAGDVTTLATVPADALGSAQILAKQPGIIAGNWVAEMVFVTVEPRLRYQFQVAEGAEVAAGMVVATIEGPTRGILMAERTALNLLARLSGVATLTRQFVQQVAGTGVKILDTRKTTPGLRFFEKYAVTIGGGFNHRFGLSDMALIKENHIQAAGSIEVAVQACRQHLRQKNLALKIEVETRNLVEVEAALKLKVDRIMFDNMPADLVRSAVAMVQGQVEVEVSGGVNLENIRHYAIPGVNYISVGALTHSVPALDLSLLLK